MLPVVKSYGLLFDVFMVPTVYVYLFRYFFL